MFCAEGAAIVAAFQARGAGHGTSRKGRWTMCKTRKFLTEFWAEESGISSVEYALLLAFIGGGIILAADALATAVADQMNETAACISGGAVACT